MIAYCRLGLESIGADAPFGPMPFGDEVRDLQVALVSPMAGRVRHARDSSRGGFLDRLDHFLRWDPAYEIGHVEVDTDAASGERSADLRLVMMAGRRAAPLAEPNQGLLSGWNDRSRAWRVETEGPVGVLLSLGICEMAGVFKGEDIPFMEMLDAIAGPAQIVYVPDVALVPNAAVIAEQIRRAPGDLEAIARDLAETLAAGPVTPGPADWLFAGTLLSSLSVSPVTERQTVLCADGLRTVGPPDAIVLSLNSEPTSLLRHRRLGYVFQCHDYRWWDAGPAVRAWLRAHFEPVRREIDDIRADYRALIDLIREAAPATQILICNVMSTSGSDDIQSYAAFDAPITATLSGVRARAMNLMLHDLASERDIAIIDCDAIAADLGGQRCLPDGVHQNGEMQAEIRAEILRVLRARGVPGFSAAGGSERESKSPSVSPSA